MAINNGKLLSGAAPVVPYDELTAGRYEFVTLGQTEPSLGAGAANSVLTLGTGNARIWSSTVTLTSITSTGNLEAGNVFFGSGVVSGTGNIYANKIFANIQGNIDAAGNLYEIQFNTTGDQLGANANFTYDFANNVLTVANGNIVTSNVSATGNVSGGNILFGAGIVSGTGNIYANKIFANIQGNIDAAGNLYEVQFNGPGDALSATANFIYDSANNVLTVNNGNIVGGNILTAGRVSATGNVYGSWFVGNVDAETVTATANISGGNILTAGQVSATGAGTFGNVLTGGTVSATSTIQGGNILTPGEVSATGSLTGGNIATGGTVSAVSTITGGNLATAGSVTATGTITGGNIVTGGIVSATGEISGGNISTTGNVTASNVNATTGFFGNINLTGDITVNSLTSNTFVSATGNVIGSNILTTGNVSATGNITGNYFIGNGAFLTGIDTTLISNGNTNVQTYANGNVSVTVAGVANTVVFTVAGTDITGNATVTGNVSGGNIATAGEVSAAGNITGANVNTATVYSATDLLLNPTGNIVLDAGKWINNVNNPIQAQDAATKQYVDNAVSSGIHIHQPVYLETPVALPSATYAQGGNTYTVNQTIAGNTVVFSTAANLQPNDQLWFSNSFEGIVGNIAYFVVSTPNTSAAVLSTAYGGVPVSNITSNTGLTQSVRVNSGVGATLTATANGILTVDSVTVSANDRILVYNQANAVENGVYVVSQTGNATTPFILTRSSDTDRYVPDDNTGLDQGSYFYVQAGATGAGESYVMTNPAGPFVIGYSNVEFTQFSASQVYTANTAAGLSLTGTVFSAKVDNNTTAFDGGGNIIVKAGANLTTPNIGAATGSSLSVTGNVTGGNITTAGSVTATGNITGGNIATAGNITATGNVTGNYFIGNGSQLTGVTATNVDAGALTGNTLSANVLFSSLTTVGTLTSLSVSGNIDGGNIATAGVVTATGSVTGGNLVTSGAITATGSVTGGNVFTGGVVSATSNVTGGNLITGGSVTATGTVYSGNVLTPGEVSAGGSLTGGNIFTGGQISAVSTITGGNIATTGFVTATGNITGGNIVSAGQISATGNITAPAFLGNLEGTIASLSGNVIGGNLFTSGAVSATGDVTGGNIFTSGQISATGNVTAPTFAGNLEATTVSASANITGGNILFGSGIVSGTGNIYANKIFANIQGNIDAAGNLYEVQFNGPGDALSANVNFTYDSSNNVFTVNNGNVVAGNLSINNNISAVGNITGNTVVVGNITIPSSGNITVGNVRIANLAEPVFNQDAVTKRYVDSAVGNVLPIITNQTIFPDGSSLTYTLDQSTTAVGIFVTVNGVAQTPNTSYTVVANQITFAQALLITDVVQVRFLSGATNSGIIYTVDSLPLASAAGPGARAFVNDSNTTVFYSNVGNSGSNFVPVFSDGSTWRVG